MDMSEEGEPGQVDGWMDGWMDGRTDTLVEQWLH